MARSGKRFRPSLEPLEDRLTLSASAPDPTAGEAGGAALVGDAPSAPGSSLAFAPVASRHGGAVYVYKQAWAPGLEQMVDLRAYVHYPPGFVPGSQAPRPALVFFHGGGWSAGDPIGWFPESLYFASLGLITISVQYRLLSVDGGTYTGAVADAIADARSAIRWVRKYAVALGVNPSEVAAGGDSAGGQLALATATVPGFDDEAGGPDGTISASPDLLLVAYPVADTGFDEGLSPYAFVNGTNLPPTLYLQGTADTLTPFATASNFCDKANALAGQPVCDLVAVPGAPHGFLDTRRFYRQALLAMDMFLQARGWLPSSPGLRAETTGHAWFVKPMFDRLWARENGYTGDYLNPGGVW